MWDMFGEMIPNQHGGVNLGAIHRYACRALADYGEPNMTALCSAIHTSLGGDGSPCEMEACLVNDTELWEALQDPGFSEDYDEKVLQFDKSKISRQFFKDTVRRQAARNDAFFTLPITIIYIICFFLLVIDHLNIFQRHQLETSLEDWTMGRKVARTCKNEVDDLNSWWTWVMGGGNRSRYGLPALLGEDLLVTGPFCRYVLASSNTLIGDVELRRYDLQGNRLQMWLIHSDVGNQKLAETEGQPNRYLLAAQATVESMQKQAPWNRTSDLSEIELMFVTYNDDQKMYASTTLHVLFRLTGKVDVKVNTEAVRISHWTSWHTLTFDILYLLIVLYLAYTEGEEMYQSVRHGCTVFFSYWGFWNTVDWICVFLGFFNALLLGLIYLRIHGRVLREILNKDCKLSTDPMQITTEQLASITDRVHALERAFYWLRCVMAVNTVSIILKFFKGFTSNPRLKVVTTTFTSAWDDLFHFGLVFWHIFMPFVVVGHILFGNDIPQFCSLAASVNIGITILFGDFEWYQDVSAEASTTQHDRITQRLPSGMPLVIVSVWYVLYMFLILLVLLNMLLAIIMEHYSIMAMSMKKRDVDAPVIWVQMLEFMKFTRDTRNFIPLEKIRRQLQKQDAHKSEHVSVRSLTEEMSMTREQAEWLCKFLAEKLEQRHACLEKAPVSTNELANMMHLHDEILNVVARVLQRENAATQAHPQNNCMHSVSSQPSTAASLLDDLIQEVTQQIDDIYDRQQRLEKGMMKVAASLLKRRRALRGFRIEFKDLQEQDEDHKLESL